MQSRGAARARDKSSSGNVSVQFSIEPEKRLVRVKFGKVVVARDIGNYAERLRSDPAFDPTFSEIVDLRAVEELDLQAADFIRLADEVDPFLLNAKRAFVVDTPVQSHAARMHKILRAQRNIEIFETIEAAELWIRS